jgi:hypothetical protein
MPYELVEICRIRLERSVELGERAQVVVARRQAREAVAPLSVERGYDAARGRTHSDLSCGNANT